MATKTLPATLALRAALDYDPSTGILTWTSGRRDGEVAGTLHPSGYRQLSFENKTYLAHRIIWRMVTGRVPHEIDHVNLVKGDNRWSNLREATTAQNGANKRAMSNNRCGLKGVYFNNNAWAAEIQVHGVRHYLGRFATSELAAAAYSAASLRLCGEFGRTA